MKLFSKDAIMAGLPGKCWMCMSLIVSRYCHVEEPILSRYNGSFEVALIFFYHLTNFCYNKWFLLTVSSSKLKFVSQANSGTPNCGMYKLLHGLA